MWVLVREPMNSKEANQFYFGTESIFPYTNTMTGIQAYITHVPFLPAHYTCTHRAALSSESLYLHNSTCKIWTQNELTPLPLRILMGIGSSSICQLHVCFRAPACPVALAKDGGGVGCCLPGCQPAFLGRSNAYCWSSQVGCSWSGASEDAPVSPIKTLHKVAGLLDSTHHLGPKPHFSVTGVFIT